MNDKQIIENIIMNIVASFTGAQSTRDWTDETVWREHGSWRGGDEDGI